MASNNFANIAAATAAGWKLRRPVVQGVRFVTELSLQVQGQPGAQGEEIVLAGESAVSSAAADTAALGNANGWRANRYGSDSGGQNVSAIADATATPSSVGVVRNHQVLQKDKH